MGSMSESIECSLTSDSTDSLFSSSTSLFSSFLVFFVGERNPLTAEDELQRHVDVDAETSVQ